MKSTIIASILILVAIITGFAIRDRVSVARVATERMALSKKFYRGLAAPIPGPYAKPGKLAEFKYQAFDFSGLGFKSISDKGDILYKAGSGKGSFKLLTREGKAVQFPEADKVLMTPDGQITQLVGESDHSVNVTLVKADGKRVDQNNRNYAACELAWGENLRVGSQGFSDRGMSATGSFTYFDFDLNQRNIELHDANTFFVQAESSVVGDIGRGFGKGSGNTKNLGILKDGKIEFEDIPIPHEYFQIVASGAKIGITAGRVFEERIPYIRTGKGTYERLPVPKGTIQAEIEAISSRGDCLISVSEPCRCVKKHPAFPYDGRHYIISDGKYYDLGNRDPLLTLTPKNPGSIESQMKNHPPEGDLVFHGRQPFLLFKRSSS